tara:strand:+ start:551 stop:844 length:294 start_codon:yes stop_codon:yes gene_type:complete
MGIYGRDKKDLDKELVKERIEKNGELIISALIEHYISGLMDDPHSNDIFMTTMMLIAEGKVKGLIRNKENPKVEWALIDDNAEPWNVVDTCYYGVSK